MSNTHVTESQVSQWVGPHFTREEFIKLLAELANEQYLAVHFANDVLAIEGE